MGKLSRSRLNGNVLSRGLLPCGLAFGFIVGMACPMLAADAAKSYRTGYDLITAAENAQGNDKKLKLFQSIAGYSVRSANDAQAVDGAMTFVREFVSRIPPSAENEALAEQWVAVSEMMMRSLSVARVSDISPWVRQRLRQESAHFPSYGWDGYPAKNFTDYYQQKCREAQWQGLTGAAEINGEYEILRRLYQRNDWAGDCAIVQLATAGNPKDLDALIDRQLSHPGPPELMVGISTSIWGRLTGRIKDPKTPAKQRNALLRYQQQLADVINAGLAGRPARGFGHEQFQTRLVALGHWLPLNEKAMAIRGIFDAVRSGIKMGPAIAAQIRPYLRDTNPEVVQMALGTLSAMEDRGSGEDMARLAASATDPRIRYVAIEALPNCWPAKSPTFLKSLLADPNPRVRVLAAGALGATGDSSGYALALESLGSQDSGLSDDAARALGKIGKQEALEPLRKAAAKRTGGLDLGLAWAILKLEMKNCPDEVHRIALLQTALGGSEPAQSRAAASLLGSINNPLAEAALQSAAADSNNPGRASAQQVLQAHAQANRM